MVEYKCMDCNKKVSQDYLRKKIRCPYCGYRILFKVRSAGETTYLTPKSLPQMAAIDALYEDLEGALTEKLEGKTLRDLCLLEPTDKS